MVSGTRCPAGSYKLKKWSESRAAASKGQCPVGHRDEFPYVLRGHIWDLSSNITWYSMGNWYFFFNFSSICHVIRWEFYIFLSFHRFSTSINGKHTFFCFFINFLYYSMGNLHFVNFPCYSMGILGLRSFRGGMYGQTDVLQDIHSLGPLPKKEAEFSPQRNRLCCVVTIQSECQIDQ